MTSDSSSKPLAVITGAAGGIGAGLARVAAKRGYRVLLADQDGVALDKTAKSIPGANFQTIDVSKPDQLEVLAEKADALGGADLLFNNAGILRTGYSWEISPDVWAESFAVNVGGIINGIRSFVPRMIERGSPARIVNTSSVGGFLTSPLMSPYSASKFAVVALTEALALELEMVDAPVSVSLLAPGPVKTSLLQDPNITKSNLAAERLMRKLEALSENRGLEPDTLATLVFKAIARGDYWLFPQPERLDQKLAERNEMVRRRRYPTASSTKYR